MLTDLGAHLGLLLLPGCEEAGVIRPHGQLHPGHVGHLVNPQLICLRLQHDTTLIHHGATQLHCESKEDMWMMTIMGQLMLD